jgi:hypothetical protein
VKYIKGKKACSGKIQIITEEYLQEKQLKLKRQLKVDLKCWNTKITKYNFKLSLSRDN